MNGRVNLGACVVAMMLITGCGGAAAPPASVVSSSSSSPAAAAGSGAPVASVPWICDAKTVGCAGPLEAGTRETIHFERPFSFSVDAGWTNRIDVYRAYKLTYMSDPDDLFLVFTRAAPAKQQPDCGPARRDGFGTSVSEWMRSLTTDDRLTVSKPETFQIGTHQATRVQIQPRSTFDKYCEGNTDPLAIIVTDTEVPPIRHQGTDGRPTAMTLVDFGDDAVVIWTDGQSMLDASLPVIKSIQFKN
jgi:hypothetical protein